jgi:hypothetical protein
MVVVVAVVVIVVAASVVVVVVIVTVVVVAKLADNLFLRTYSTFQEIPVVMESRCPLLSPRVTLQSNSLSVQSNIITI